MAGFYEKMQRKGYSLLKKRGMPITLNREQQGTYNPNTGTTGTVVVTPYACFGFISNIDSAAANQFYATSALRASCIEKEDKMVVLSALDTEGVQLDVVPNPISDKLVILGVTYDIVAVIPLSPAGIDILYSLQVRR